MRTLLATVLVVAVVSSGSFDRASSGCYDPLAVRVDHDLRSGAIGDVKIGYSWTKGNGLCEVFVDLNSQSESSVRVVTSSRRALALGLDSKTLKARIPPDRFKALLELMNESRLLCASRHARRMCFADFGRYSVTVRAGTLKKELVVDGENLLDDSGAFGKVVELIVAMKDVFGEDFNCGPIAFAAVPCKSTK